MERPLLVRPAPLLGEGLRGYFLRLSEANGLLPQYDLYRAVLPPRDARTIAAAEQAASTLGLDPARLAGLACGTLANDITRCQHKGQTVSRLHLRSRQCAVCPRCLAIQSAIWADWELAAQVACPEHGCWLIDTCPRCERAIVWRRKGVSTCLCGFDLRRAGTAEAAAPVLLLASAIRYRLFADLPSAAELPDGVPDLLLRCTFNELLGLFYFFRREALRSVVRSPQGMSGTSQDFRSQAAAAICVWEAVADWPGSWRRMLDLFAAPALSAFPALDDHACHIISEREARAPFDFIQRSARVASEEMPVQFRGEVARRIQSRAIFAGHRRLFAAADLNRERSDRGGRRLKLLNVTFSRGHEAFALDRMSNDALRDLFDASPHQIEVLRRVGVLPKASWPTAAEVDSGMALLARFARVRRPSVDREMVRLSEISVDGGPQLETHLRDVMRGRTPVVNWASKRALTLRNLFISEARALEVAGSVHQPTK